MALLELHNLHARIQNAPILKGASFTLETGQTTALMGPNGSGKSTLAHILMGHPDYEVTEGQILFNGEDLLSLKPEERATRGVFLSFQYPQSIAGVSVGNFLRLAYSARMGHSVSVKDFIPILKQNMDQLHISQDFITRSVNEGFSGGEKKRFEILQLALLKPALSILDETDSGLDVDALRSIGQALASIREHNPAMSLLVITHYSRFLEYVPVNRVLIMKNGVVIKEGTASLVEQIQTQGYKL